MKQKRVERGGGREGEGMNKKNKNKSFPVFFFSVLEINKQKKR